jgi:hypothetical protein
LALVGLIGGLGVVSPIVLPIDAAAFGTFRQDQRINHLTLQGGTDTFATKNAYGGAFTSAALSQMQTTLDSSVTSGDTSLLLEMPTLTDLTGTNQASLQLGVVNAVPVSTASPYSGNSDLDWWYAPRPLEVDGSGLPKVQLSGSIASHALTAGGGAMLLLSLSMSTVQIAATTSTTTSHPATSTGNSPPGHPAGEYIDPSLVSFEAMSAGQFKGNISAASLAATPIPQGATTGGVFSCSQNYTSTNTWLDLLVTGCGNTLFGPFIRATQPDLSDPAAPAAGAGAPYVLSANPARAVSTCKDKNSTVVPLATCLTAAAYSSYFTFTTDRVIGKSPQVVAFTSTPPTTPLAGGSYSATASGGPSGNPVVFSADATSTAGACTVSSAGLVSFTGAGTCVVDADQTGGAIYFAAPRASQVLTVSLPAVAVFPAMTNAAYGGYITAATIQNTGSAPASIRIAYFNQSGAAVGAGDSISSLPVNASWTVRQDNGNSFPSTGGNGVQAGSAIVYSSQPVASFVNEFAPGNVGDATSYTGVQVPAGVGTTLYAPTIVNNAYGGYTTGIGLLNQGGSPTDVTITYRDALGTVVKTQTVTGLAAHAYQALYSGDTTLALPSGFAGTATIAAAQPLGAIVNETGPGGQFSSYDAVPSGSTLLNAPVALNNAYGGYYTGMGIQNTSASAGTVSVTYYDTAGAATVKSFSIAAFGSLGVYQGSAADGPAVGAYTAVIQSTLPLAAIVNEVAPSSISAKQSTSYNTFSSGAAILQLPLVENAGSDPWNTGLGIMNTSSTSTTVVVNYYDAVIGTVIGTTQVQTLAPRAFWGLYQPTGGLPSGSRATAVVRTSGGGQMAVICNESSPTTFMSYSGQ